MRFDGQRSPTFQSLLTKFLQNRCNQHYIARGAKGSKWYRSGRGRVKLEARGGTPFVHLLDSIFSIDNGTSCPGVLPVTNANRNASQPTVDIVSMGSITLPARHTWERESDEVTVDRLSATDRRPCNYSSDEKVTTTPRQEGGGRRKEVPVVLDIFRPCASRTSPCKYMVSKGTLSVNSSPSIT